MHVLVDKQTQKVLAVGDPAAPVTGEWAEWTDSGRAVWTVVPDGSEPDTLTVATDGTAVVDPTKVAAKEADRAARVAERQARLDTIRGLKTANTILGLRAVVEAMAKEQGFPIDP